MEPAIQERSNLGCIGRFVLVASLVAGAGALGFLGGQKLAPAPESAKQASVQERVADTATVLLAVRSLARIETVAYHMERVVDLKQRQPRMFGLIGANDWILLIAVGDAIAGVDLSKMSEGDISVDPATRQVRVRLPPPELLSVALDNARTYVHTRKTDMMADRNEEMETRARRLGEESIRAAALDSNILDRARQGAEQTLTVLVRSLGFEQVEFMRAER